MLNLTAKVTHAGQGKPFFVKPLNYLSPYILIHSTFSHLLILSVKLCASLFICGTVCLSCVSQVEIIRCQRSSAQSSMMGKKKIASDLGHWKKKKIETIWLTGLQWRKITFLLVTARTGTQKMANRHKETEVIACFRVRRTLSDWTGAT